MDSDRELTDVRLEASVVAAPPEIAHASIDEVSEDFTFGLSTLFLLTTLCAGWALAATVSMSLAVFLAILSVPALFRTTWAADNYRRRTGRTMPALEKGLEFVISLTVVFAIPFVALTFSLVTAILFIVLGLGLIGLLNTQGGDVLQAIALTTLLLGGLCSVIAGIYGLYQAARILWPIERQE